MTLFDVLARLRNVTPRPDVSGNYYAECPCSGHTHGDHKPSLAVKLGDKGGILFTCRSQHHTADQIVEAMGLKMADVMGVQAAPKAQSGGNFLDWKKADAVYDYTDEHGHILYQVARFRTLDKDGKPDKTFRQRKPDGRGGWIYKDVRKNLRSVCYKLPDVRKAVVEGRTVFLVEGEKDVRTMAEHGYAATCNAGGAVRDMEDTRWTPDLSSCFDGADVVIIPDHDSAGEIHADCVQVLLQGHARRIRRLPMILLWPEVPDKGDITDAYKARGGTLWQTLETQLTTLKDLPIAPDDLPGMDTPEEGPEKPQTDYERACETINAMGGYRVEHGCVCQYTEKGLKTLCSFVAMPSRVTSHDDGENVYTTFTVRGWDQSGRELRSAVMGTDEFAGLNWVIKNWNVKVNIWPGSTVKDKLRFLFTAIGNRTAVEETVYTHTGWRSINGKLCYLYPGGAVGTDGVNVALDSALSRYRFTDVEFGPADLFAAQMTLKASMPQRVILPLMAMVHLAPLKGFLQQKGHEPLFSMFLLGGSQTHKSTAAALALNYFGEFGQVGPFPATFMDTQNAVNGKAFALKDCLLVVDDYHPVSGQQEKRKMEAIAQSLGRMFGNGVGRGRMNADGSLRTDMAPRCLAIMTGEDFPSSLESAKARFYMIKIKKTTLPLTDELRTAQELAGAGYFRAAMKRYIGWLAGQADTLPDKVTNLFLQAREKASVELHIGGRALETVAHLMTGYMMMTEHFVAEGFLSSREADLDVEDAWRHIAINAAAQSAEAVEERPSSAFLRVVSELIGSRSVGIDSVDGNAAKGWSARQQVGWFDANNYYFLPELLYTTVCETYSRQGGAFPLTKNALFSQLKEDKLLIPGGDGKSTRPKNVAGSTRRLLTIPRAYVDNGSAQITMDDMEQLPDGDTPEEFREGGGI